MEASSIWKKLIIDRLRIADSNEIRDLARELGKDEWRSLKYLQSQRYILRILRGIFYVRSPEERELGTYDASIHELVGMALEKKGVKRWYFGIESALKLNLMTHEYFNIEYVITDSFRTTKSIKILDTYFSFLKRNGNYFGYGLKKQKNFWFSDPEKTVLDMTYERYLKVKDSSYFLSPIMEYRDQMNMIQLKKYLVHYSRRFRKLVEAEI